MPVPEEERIDINDKLQTFEKEEENKESFFWPVSIDQKSRLIFPFTFFVFNILYWGFCLSDLESLPNDIVGLPRFSAST